MAGVTWLDKPRGNWWTKEAVASVVSNNIGNGKEVDGVTHMMVAAYKQWADIQILLNLVHGDDPKLQEIRVRHEKYKAKIDEAAAWRAELLEQQQ